MQQATGLGCNGGQKELCAIKDNARSRLFAAPSSRDSP